MNTKRSNTTVTCGLILMVAILSGICFPGAASGTSMLTAGVFISDTFMPGFGAPVGKIQRVSGEVVVMHAQDRDRGYRARPGLPLYKGDAVITLEKGKVRFKLNDGSILSLASGTKLELSKSVYDEKKKSRSSFLNMAFGKARFLVVKLLSFKRSEFKVKTPTAVCGVRGSDFVIAASAIESSAAAFENTALELVSLMYPDAEPVVLKDFETSKVYRGEYPTEPIQLSPEEVQRLKEVFISVDPADSGSGGDGALDGTGTVTGGVGVEAKEARVLVSDDAIGELPGDFDVKDVEVVGINESVETSGVIEERSAGVTVRSDIVEEVREDSGRLPEFPQVPE